MAASHSPTSSWITRSTTSIDCCALLSIHQSTFDKSILQLLLFFLFTMPQLYAALARNITNVSIPKILALDCHISLDSHS